jgi:alpha-beta hydrolase superfamily lysophospholipase
MSSYTHHTGTFIGSSNNELFFQKWETDDARLKLIIIHGLGEHSGRYGNLISKLKGRRVSVYAYDHRGHGRSSGKRGHIDSFKDYINDMKIFVEHVKLQGDAIPTVILGHSLGGVIALRYALEHPGDMAALVLSSPGLIPAFIIPAWRKAMAGVMNVILPSLLQPNGLDAKDLSHDPRVVEEYRKDPLVHDRVSVRFFLEFSAAEEECLNRAVELSMPLLIFHGPEDRIVSPAGSQQVYDRASSSDKTLYLFKGFFHETMNETNRDDVFKILAPWILGHAAKKAVPVKARKAPARAITTKAAAKKPAAKHKPKK